MRLLAILLLLPSLALAGDPHHSHPSESEPVAVNVPDSSSNKTGVVVGVVLVCLGIEAFTDGTCRFWRWNIWKPTGKLTNTSSVPEPEVNEYLRIRKQ